MLVTDGPSLCVAGLYNRRRTLARVQRPDSTKYAMTEMI